ncbi:hypothetical protein FEO91_08230 [Stenotrophomonas maltophilia]|nr:hypothetical protein FEO91_08230 [Stenotrophomonas maltophilia]
MAKPRTAPSGAPKTVQDSKPAAAPAVTEEKPAETATAQLDPPADANADADSKIDVDAAASSDLTADPALAPAENDQAPGAGGDVTASAPPATADAAGVNSHDDDAPARVCFEVLTPFKFKGHPVKPPAWIEISEDDAAIYQAAGVLGTEPAEPFDHV